MEEINCNNTICAYNQNGICCAEFSIHLVVNENSDVLSYWGKANGSVIDDPVSIESGSTINQPNSSADTVQIPLIITAADSAIDSTGRDEGTVLEQCFDVITLTETGIVMTRIGAGDNRSLTITRNT